MWVEARSGMVVTMRRIKLLIGMIAVIAVMMVGAAPAMADDDCYWYWGSHYGWYVACDDDDWYDDDSDDEWHDDDSDDD
jgi:hypothetical protein